MGGSIPRCREEEEEEEAKEEEESPTLLFPMTRLEDTLVVELVEAISAISRR
jgi:hypothetical protein